MVKIYTKQTRDEVSVRAAITNSCLARFDRGDLRYLCDACPVNLGKCLYSGCAYTGFQRTSAECVDDSAICDTPCDAGTPNVGYCTSDSQCAVCTHTNSNYYLSTSGACKACSLGCQACTNSLSCYECTHPTAAPWTGGISLQKGKCSGVFALQLNAECMLQGLRLPMPAKTTYPAWTVSLWVYIQAAVPVLDVDTDYEILNVGDYQLTYTSINTFRMYSRAGDVYEDTTPANAFTVGKWTRVSFAISTSQGSLMVWNNFAVTSRLSLGVSKFSTTTIASPFFSQPKQLVLCSKKCNVLVKDLRLWSESRTEQQVFDTMFQVMTRPPSTLAGYWRLDEDLPMVFDYSYNALNLTLPQTRGECWWKEQEVQYIRHTESSLNDVTQVASAGTAGFLQCAENRQQNNILMLCSDEIRFVFGQKCMPQDILDINRTVVGRRGSSELADADTDPIYDGKDAGLYFNEKAYLEIDPKRQAFQPVSETRWGSRQSDSRGVRMPMSLMDFTVQAWVKPASLPTSAFAEDNGDVTNVYSLFSIMHTNGHHQFLWFIHKDGLGVSYRSATTGARWGMLQTSTTHPTPTSAWTFIQYTFTMSTTSDVSGSVTMVANSATLTLPSSGLLSFGLGRSLKDFVVREQAPMYLGTSVKGTTFNNFYKGYIFEFALSNYAKPLSYTQAYDYSTSVASYSPWFGSTIGTDQMTGDVCACHFSCLTCKSPRTGLPTDCTSCAAPLVLTTSNTCDLACPAGTVMDSQTTRKCVAAVAPVVKQAAFRGDFMGIDVTFDVEVAPTTRKNDCARMFAPETSVQFGANSFCTQSAPTTISVYFGLSPSLPLGGQIKLHPLGFLKANSDLQTYASTGPYTLKDPASLLSPTAIVAVADLSPVDGTDVTVDASFSRGGLGRLLTYQWTVTADGVSLSPQLTTYLGKFAGFTGTSRLTIPAALAPTSVRVTYTVTVMNWLQQTNTVSIDSFHTVRPAPILYFTQGRVWTVNRWQTNVFQLKLTKSNLSSIPSDNVLTARIVDTNADLVANPLPLPTSQFLQQNQTLSIPPFTLQVSKYYKIVVELTSVLHPESNTFASLLLNVRQSGFVAQIVGGDRTIGGSDKVNVTAVGSIELDTKSDANLAYAWACGSCTPATATGVNYLADLVSTAVGTTVKVGLTVTSTIKNDVRTASEYAEFSVVSGSRPYMFIHRLTNSTNYQLLPEKANFLHSESYDLNSTLRIEPHVSWSASPAPMDFTPSFAPRKHFLNTVMLGTGMYVPMQQYQVSITLDEVGLYTSAWLRAPVNARPVGCCFTATFVAGSRNLFLFDAGQHEDPDFNYPLSYVFGLEKYSAHLNFGRQTQLGKYILPSRDNAGEDYQQTVYVMVYDSLGAVVKETYTVTVLPESPKYTLEDFQAEAAATYAVTYNQTVLDQYVLASYASYLADQVDRSPSNIDLPQITSELESLVTLLTSIISTGDQDCFNLQVYLRDIALLSRQQALLSASAMDSLFTAAVHILGKVNVNPDKSCWTADDKARFMTVYGDFAAYFPEYTPTIGRLVPLLETFGFVALRDTYPGDSVAYRASYITAKYWRMPAEVSDLEYELYPDEFNGTRFGTAGVSFPSKALAAEQAKYGTVLDAHLVVYGFNSFDRLRIDKYQNLLAEKELDRYEVVENTDTPAPLVEARVYQSGSAVQSEVTLLDTPTLLDLSTAPVTFHLPTQGVDPSTLLYTTCETWAQSTDANTTTGEWSIEKCVQNSTLDGKYAATCQCSGLGTVTVNRVSQENIGVLRVALVQAELDPEYDLQKEINDNRGFMFYMNAIYLLFILWSLHGGAAILAYVADRDSKPEFDKDEYQLVAGTERRIDVQRLPPIPSCFTYWLNEWWLTGLIRSTKPHYTRCARVHILFSKMYVLLLVPGFFYTYYWTDNQAFNIQGYDWGVTMISLICSAAAQGLLSVLSNTRNVPVSIKRSLYIAYFGLWTTAWLAIGFWTAKGTTQTASIWCVVWILCAFIDVLIVDHIYVMVKWGFDSATDYWRTVSAARNNEAE